MSVWIEFEVPEIIEQQLEPVIYSCLMAFQ
jgi:hypothetical protein